MELLLLCLFFPNLSGGTPLQNFVLLLNSECSYEFLVLGSLSRNSGYFFLIIRTNQGVIFGRAPRMDTRFSGALVNVGVSWGLHYFLTERHALSLLSYSLPLTVPHVSVPDFRNAR